MINFYGLGSVNQYAEQWGLDPASPTTLGGYTQLLKELRLQAGIAGYRDLGSTVVQVSVEPVVATEGGLTQIMRELAE